MSTRTRQRSLKFVGKRTDTRNGAWSTQFIRTYDETCIDYEDPGDNWPFSVNRIRQSGGLLNGKGGIGPHIWENYPCAYYQDDPYSWNHLGIAGRPTNGELATQLLSRTNPTRSSTEGLVSLVELGELPSLVREGMDIGLNRLYRYIPYRTFRALKLGAKLNLMIQFGLIPLYNDLTTLLQFQKLVDDRKKELDRLVTRGLRRTIKLWEGSTSAVVPSATVQSSQAVCTAMVTKTTTLHIKGHIRWYYPQNGLLASDELIRAQAVKSVYGLRFDPRALYEALPWSWLVDYYTNLGTYIKATNNQLGLTHDTPRIMSHTRSETRGHPKSAPAGVTLSSYYCESEVKDRVLSNATLSARTEVLSASQWSILGSLSVLRTR